MIRIAPAGRERARARHEHPVIRVAHQAHQKGRHRIGIDDAVIPFAANSQGRLPRAARARGTRAP